LKNVSQIYFSRGYCFCLLSFSFDRSKYVSNILFVTSEAPITNGFQNVLLQSAGSKATPALAGKTTVPPEGSNSTAPGGGKTTVPPTTGSKTSAAPAGTPISKPNSGPDREYYFPVQRVDLLFKIKKTPKSDLLA